ncbi:hypothetical protein ABW21_db0202189 [Orbilia brochopaga]|nr:hypothetical protein ABW21_db0202189 [Drechslerella brochopaga]
MPLGQDAAVSPGQPNLNPRSTVRRKATTRSAAAIPAAVPAQPYSPVPSQPTATHSTTTNASKLLKIPNNRGRFRFAAYNAPSWPSTPLTDAVRITLILTLLHITLYLHFLRNTAFTATDISKFKHASDTLITGFELSHIVGSGQWILSSPRGFFKALGKTRWSSVRGAVAQVVVMGVVRVLVGVVVRVWRVDRSIFDVRSLLGLG